MDFQEICDRLTALGARGVLGADVPREKDPDDKGDLGRAGQSFLLVEPAALIDLLFLCRDDSELEMSQLVDLSATDPVKGGPDLWVNYELLSISKRHRLALKCVLPKEGASIASATAVFASARWGEREASEMLGIDFDGHPDPRNILLPDDWEGYPLRKDYEFPTEYHGISCV